MASGLRGMAVGDGRPDGGGACRPPAGGGVGGGGEWTRLCRGGEEREGEGEVDGAAVLARCRWPHR